MTHEEHFLARLAKPLARRTSQATIIQDLNTLALLGRNSRQLQLLKKTNLDPATLAEGAAASPRLSAYLAQAEVARDKRSVVVQIRSKVYAYLKQAVDEIRPVGILLSRRIPRAARAIPVNITNATTTKPANNCRHPNNYRRETTVPAAESRYQSERDGISLAPAYTFCHSSHVYLRR